MGEWMNTETTAAQASSAVETELSRSPWNSGAFSAGPLKRTHWMARGQVSGATITTTLGPSPRGILLKVPHPFPGLVGDEFSGLVFLI